MERTSRGRGRRLYHGRRAIRPGRRLSDTTSTILTTTTLVTRPPAVARFSWCICWRSEYHADESASKIRRCANPSKGFSWTERGSRYTATRRRVKNVSPTVLFHDDDDDWRSATLSSHSFTRTSFNGGDASKVDLITTCLCARRGRIQHGEMRRTVDRTVDDTLPENVRFFFIFFYSRVPTPRYTMHNGFVVF